MLNLDIRDLEFWMREAKKKLLKEHLLRTRAARVAMAKDKDYRNYMSEIQQQIRETDIDAEELIKENWETLKYIRKG
ncbi:MAG: hypothetical protein WC261_04500 [Synergistaceae bacterium]